eukprot:6572243-Lingulodinium_polyedra.AAC.1
MDDVHRQDARAGPLESGLARQVAGAREPSEEVERVAIALVGRPQGRKGRRHGGARVRAAMR